jgi:hypothetical protein
MFGKIVNGVFIYAPKILNGKINPSEATLREAGFLPVVFSEAPKVEDGFVLDCKWVQEPDRITQKWQVRKDNSPVSAEFIAALFARQHIQSIGVDDNTALRMMSFYPEWEPGKAYAVGNKLTRSGKLYKVIQPHTAQVGWEPENVPALFTEICETHDGTIEDPIPYSGNMALEKGKHYMQDGEIYRCTRDTVNPVYHALSELVGLYVEIA